MGVGIPSAGEVQALAQALSLSLPVYPQGLRKESCSPKKD